MDFKITKKELTEAQDYIKQHGYRWVKEGTSVSSSLYFRHISGNQSPYFPIYASGYTNGDKLITWNSLPKPTNVFAKNMLIAMWTAIPLHTIFYHSLRRLPYDYYLTAEAIDKETTSLSYATRILIASFTDKPIPLAFKITPSFYFNDLSIQVEPV